MCNVGEEARTHNSTLQKNREKKKEEQKKKKKDKRASFGCHKILKHEVKETYTDTQNAMHIL